MPDENNDVQTREVRTLTNLLEKNGNDALKLAESLLADNAEWREKNRQLKAKLPANGREVFPAEEAKTLKELKAFLEEKNLDLKTLRETVEKVPELENKAAELQRKDVLRDVAATGFDLDVLVEQMGKFPGATYTVKTQKDAKDPSSEQKVPYVSLDGKESSLEDFAKENFPKYLPVLKVSNEAQTPLPGNKPNPPMHSASQADILKNEVTAQAATGRYSL